MNRPHSVMLVVTAAVAAAAGFYGSRLSEPRPSRAGTATTEEAPPVPVGTAVVTSGELKDVVTAYGVVQTRPADTVGLSVPFEAVTRTVHVAVGETVAGDTPLVDVDASPDARLQLRQAEEAAAAADRAVEQAARRRDQQLATNADVTAAEQTRQAARTQLDALNARGVGGARTLTAGKPGWVTAVAAQPGQVTPAGTPLVTVSPDNGVEVRVSVDPLDATDLRPGDSMSVVLPGSTSTLFATVRQVSRVLNPQTRSCDVFVRPADGAGLRPGAFVGAEFARRTVTGLIVPRVATQREDDDWCLYVVKDGKAVRHVVTLGPTDGRDIVVSGTGLAEGDAVVTERDGELADGVAVQAEAPDEDGK